MLVVEWESGETYFAQQGQKTGHIVALQHTHQRHVERRTQSLCRRHCSAEFAAEVLRRETVEIQRNVRNEHCGCYAAVGEHGRVQKGLEYAAR